MDRQPHEEFKLFRSDWQPSDQLYAGLALEFALSTESIKSACGQYIAEFMRQNIRHEEAKASSWNRKFLEFMASAIQRTEPQTAKRLRQYRKSLKRKSELLRHGDRVSREIIFTDWDHYSEQYEECVRDPDYTAYINSEHVQKRTAQISRPPESEMNAESDVYREDLGDDSEFLSSAASV